MRWGVGAGPIAGTPTADKISRAGASFTSLFYKLFIFPKFGRHKVEWLNPDQPPETPAMPPLEPHVLLWVARSVFRCYFWTGFRWNKSTKYLKIGPLYLFITSIIHKWSKVQDTCYTLTLIFQSEFFLNRFLTAATELQLFELQFNTNIKSKSYN